MENSMLHACFRPKEIENLVVVFGLLLRIFRLC